MALNNEEVTLLPQQKYIKPASHSSRARLPDKDKSLSTTTTYRFATTLLFWGLSLGTLVLQPSYISLSITKHGFVLW
ncbi:hypothetical protein J6590_025995 [Homalodisca vitripennis]|nr:hypothetical protein J6590_025995 [Homalodisca vitripennis]